MFIKNIPLDIIIWLDPIKYAPILALILKFFRVAQQRMEGE